jgi:hypothetical protein
VVLGGGEDDGRWLGAVERQFSAGLGRQSVRTVLSLAKQADLEELAGLLAAGTLRPSSDRVIALAEVPSSMTDLGAGKRVVTFE